MRAGLLTLLAMHFSIVSVCHYVQLIGGYIFYRVPVNAANRTENHLAANRVNKLADHVPGSYYEYLKVAESILKEAALLEVEHAAVVHEVVGDNEAMLSREVALPDIVDYEYANLRMKEKIAEIDGKIDEVLEAREIVEIKMRQSEAKPVTYSTMQLFRTLSKVICSILYSGIYIYRYIYIYIYIYMYVMFVCGYSPF